MPDTPNLTPEELADALAAIIEAVDDAGVVITDKRFTEQRGELLRLLKSQAMDRPAKGWVLSWDELPEQADDGSCEVDVTYGFKLACLHGFLNDASDQATSEVLFKRRIFHANEALNRKRDLGIDSRVRHQMLQSAGSFDVIPFGESTTGELGHYAEFDLKVKVLNTY